MKIIPTKYPHDYTALGKKLVNPCGGIMEIMCDENVHVQCSECGEKYQFQFIGGYIENVDPNSDG